jgi:hypothetical protein
MSLPFLLMFHVSAYSVASYLTPLSILLVSVNIANMTTANPHASLDVTESRENKLFLYCKAGACYVCIDLSAGVWIYWRAHGNFLEVCFSISGRCVLFWGLCPWLATFLRVARGEDLAIVLTKKHSPTGGVTVNPWCPRYWKYGTISHSICLSLSMSPSRNIV